jgi:predicted aspartyl protease
MKLSQSPDKEYEQKCTETSIDIMKTTQPSNLSSRACFGCGDTDHLVNGCPKKDVEINKVQKKRQHPQTHASTKNKQRKESTGRISYAVTGTIPYDNAVIFGTLVIHTTIATVLYDPHTTHSFISAQFATKYGIFKCPLRSRKTISTPERKMLVNYICSKVSVKINGIDFPADLLVIESMGKDVILGNNWLQRTKAVIQHRTICLETPSGERIVVEDNRPPALFGASNKEE